VRFEFEPRQRCRGQILVEEHGARLALPLRLVHRQIRLLQELLRRCAVAGGFFPPIAL